MTWCKFCPYGEAQTKIFRYLFLQRLPTEIRIILAKDRDSTLAALAARAGQLWANSTRQPHDVPSTLFWASRDRRPPFWQPFPALITPAAADGDVDAAARAARLAVKVAVALLP
jgi:hypothetical protein